MYFVNFIFSFLKENSEKIFIFLTLMNLFLFLTDFTIFGSGLNGDTPEYLYLANLIKSGEFPYSKAYLPGFPFIIYLVSFFFGAKIYISSIILIGLLYLINFFGLYLLFKLFINLSWIEKNNFWFLLFVFTSWWVFRIQKATHADALYFTFIIFYSYLLIRCLHYKKLINFICLGILLCFGTFIKYNSYVFIPITLLLIFFLEAFPVKQRILNLTLSVMPSMASIFIWRNLNGGFIHHLESKSYSKKDMSFENISDVFIKNVKDFGQTEFEIFSFPYLARNIPPLFLLITGIFLFSFLLFFILKYDRKELSFKLFGLIASIYVFSFLGLSSLNLFTELNQRTLITFNFYFVLFISIYIIKRDKNILIYIFSFLLICSTVAISLKWISTTSESNSFYYLNYDEDLAKFLKLNPEEIYFSDRPNYVMFHSDYKIKVQSFDLKRIFRFGRFENLKTDEVLLLLKEMEDNQEEGCIIIFKNYNLAKLDLLKSNETVVSNFNNFSIFKY